MMTMLIGLLRVITEALAGQRSDEEVAKALVDAAFESGVAPALLMDHLSVKGRDNAELAADIAEFAKLEVKRMAQSKFVGNPFGDA